MSMPTETFSKSMLALDAFWALVWLAPSLSVFPVSSADPVRYSVWLTITILVSFTMVFRRFAPGWAIISWGILMVIYLVVFDVYSITAVFATFAAAYHAQAYLLSRRARNMVLTALLSGTMIAAFRYSKEVVDLVWYHRFPVVIVQWVGVGFFSLLGVVVRKRKAETAALVSRARELEQQREQEIRLATMAERSRIAREMHDILAHSLTVMIAQADGGRYAEASRPGAAVEALKTIGDLSRESLAQMRQLLAVLRSDDTRSTSPAPNGEDLADLFAEYQAAGLKIHLTIGGERPTLPPTLALTIYRVLQEALTNVLRYAEPKTADVTIDWGHGWTRIAVRSPLQRRPPTTVGAGQGLVGMRERVRLHGGQLSVGAESDYWLVRVDLPIGDLK